jgi:sugar phosphate permease
MFYGWFIVAASAILNAFISGTTMYGFTAIVDPLVAAFGWTYAQISLAMTLRGVEQGILNPFMGLVADRWPARRLIFIGIILTGFGLFWLSQVNSLAMFYTSFIIIGVGGTLGTGIVTMTAIARWFQRSSGKAYGIVAAGIGAGGFLLPVVTRIVDTYGWRTYLVGLAVSILVIGIPLSLIYRNKPEDYGLLPDGKLPDSQAISPRWQAPVVSIGVKEALNTRAFWSIGIAFMLQIAGVSAVQLHIMPYLASLEVERATGSLIAMFILIVSVPSRFTFGWLSDIFKKNHIAAASMVLTSVGLFLFSIFNGTSFAFIVGFIIIYGFGVGGQVTLMPPIIREYFGSKKFGTIFGLGGIFVTIGAVSTPPLAGWVFDTRGIYDPIWLVFSCACMLGAIIMLTIPRAFRTLKT